MPEKPLVPYKSLKQKQKARIADWIYRETLRFFLQCQRMPESEEVETLCQTVYVKVRTRTIGSPTMKSGSFMPNDWMRMPCASSGMSRQRLHWNLLPSRQSRRKPRNLRESGKRKSVNPPKRNLGRMIVSFLSPDTPPAVCPMVLHGRKWSWSRGRISLYESKEFCQVEFCPPILGRVSIDSPPRT